MAIDKSKEDIELLKEIRTIWGDFSNLVSVVKHLESAGKDFALVCKNHPHFDKTNFEAKSITDRILKDISYYGVILKKYDLNQFNKCIAHFEKIVQDDKYIEFRKVIQDRQKNMSTFLDYYKQNIDAFSDFISTMRDFSYDNFPKELLKKIHTKVDNFNYSQNNDEIISFIQEIDAMLKLELLEVSNYETAKRICNERKSNIFAPGLVVHFTRDSMWHPENLVQFIRKGLVSQKSITSDVFGYFDDVVSFNLIVDTVNYTTTWKTNCLCFILDPEFVKQNHSHFLYNPLTKNTSNKNSKKFVEACVKLGFVAKKKIDSEAPEEIQSNIPIPLSAIMGAVIIQTKYVDKIQIFMNKLIRNNPELAFPIYDREGKMIWPENQ